MLVMHTVLTDRHLVMQDKLQIQSKVLISKVFSVDSAHTLMSSLPVTGKLLDSETDDKQEVLWGSGIVCLMITKSLVVLLPACHISYFIESSHHRGLNCNITAATLNPEGHPSRTKRRQYRQRNAALKWIRSPSIQSRKST